MSRHPSRRVDLFDGNSITAYRAGYRRRYFTPDQANRALVLVRRVVADVVGDYARMLDLHEAFEAAQARGLSDRSERVKEEMVLAAEKLHHCIEELEAVGVELRDWAEGIVDFPCIAGGRELYLCWQPGESVVEHWHELSESFAERKPIEQLESWELLGAGEKNLTR